MKILFLGTPQSAVPILETLNNSDHQVVGVVSQPARKKGRGQDLTESEVSAYAKSNKLPIFTPEKITKEYFDKHLVELKADIAIVVAFGQILPQDILDKIKFGWVNIHFSVLPDLRGAAPIQRAIMQGKTDLGVTIFKIDEGLDTGPIISQILYKRESSSNYQKTLHDLTEIAANNIVSILEKYESGQLKITKQNGHSSTAAKIDDKEMQIKWSDRSENIINLVNAGSYNLCAWTNLEPSKIKILEIDNSDEIVDLKPGEILVKNKMVLVGCGEGVIVLKQIIPEGKKQMDAFSWINGIQDKSILYFS